jgi:hypothetical protein
MSLTDSIPSLGYKKEDLSKKSGTLPVLCGLSKIHLKKAI